MGVAVAGSMQLPSARLRKSATMIASAIKVGYTRATSTSRDLRLVMDLDQQKIWLEETDVPMLVQSKKRGDRRRRGRDRRGARRAARGRADRQGPADPQAELPSSRDVRLRRHRGGQGRQAVAARHPVSRRCRPRTMTRARTSGRAYLYFWPGASPSGRRSRSGSASPTEDYETLTLLVAPLTGKVTVKGGAGRSRAPDRRRPGIRPRRTRGSERMRSRLLPSRGDVRRRALRRGRDVHPLRAGGPHREQQERGEHEPGRRARRGAG